MAWLYGDGETTRLPAWTTGFETPTQRDKRLRETNDALKKNQEREEAANARRLLTQFERQDIEDLKLSPPSPPRTPETQLSPDEQVRQAIGSQDRFESHLDGRLNSYAGVFGMTPLFGSQAYESAERMALEDWRDEQSGRPDDLRADAQVGLFVRSRESRVDRAPLPSLGDSKYDVLVTDLKTTVGNDEAVDTWLGDIEKDVRKELGKDATDQDVREYIYRLLRTDAHLSEVLDEIGWPRGEGIEPPVSAVDEAERREEEENGEFFKDFPGRPGFFGQLASLASKRWIPTPATPFILTGALKGQAFLSLDEYHTVLQQGLADPVSGLILRGDIPTFRRAPAKEGFQFGVEFDPIETGGGLGGAARAGEIGFEEITGVETTAVSGALRSQLAEDILSEVISPEYLLIAIPSAGVGVQGLTGAAKVVRIAANLTIGTDAGLARGFPLLRPDKIRGVFRALTAVGKSPLALRNIPRAIKNHPVFQQGLKGIQRARASVFGRSGTPEQYVKAIGADDPLRLRRVIKDIVQGNPSTADNLPLRLAVEKDLSTKRSAGSIIEDGVSIPKLGGAGGGELGAFWRGEEGFLRLGTKAEITEANIFNALTKGEIVPPGSLRTVAGDLELLNPDLVERASALELIDLLQARRVNNALGNRKLSQLKNDELLDVLNEARLPLATKPNRKTMLKELKAASANQEGLPKAIEARGWNELSDTDVVDIFKAISEGRVTPEAIPTQLVRGGINKFKWEAWDTARSLSDRQKSMDTYLTGVEKMVAKEKEGSFARRSLELDAKIARWDFDVRFGIKPLSAAQEEIIEPFKILTAAHRGTPEERLAKLTPQRAKEIKDELSNFLDKFPKLAKGDRTRMAKRLLLQALDAEEGLEIYDVGRQLETMLNIVGMDQDLKNSAYRALQLLTTKGETPTPARISAMRKVLDPVLGKGATSQLLNSRRLDVKGRELVVNTIGLPRALMASSDISALGRQGAILGARMPIQWIKMAGRSIRAFWQPEYADEVRRSIINSGVIRLEGGEVVDVYQYATKTLGKNQLFLASDAGQLGLTFKEEEYMTHFASKWGWHLPRDAKGHLSAKLWDLEKVPFPVPLAQSERAYVMGLDKLRMDFFANEMKKIVKRGLAGGTTPTTRDFEQLALFVNNSSGRGNMWEWMRDWHPALNALFFAPRLVISRFAIVGDVARHTARGGPMRQVVWETLAADGATLAGALFLINTSLNAVGIESGIGLNPLKKGDDGKWRRDTDFLKITVGDTHIDFLASMGPTQKILVGLSAAIVQGDLEMAQQLATQFLRSKESPVASGAHEVITGKDFVGGKVEYSLEGLLLDVVASRVMPLSWQGPVEAVAAARGEFDIDTGEAVIDLAVNKPNKDEVVVAGIALSAELIGGGVVSFFNPGQKLDEADEERLQEMLATKQITPADDQVIEKVSDLDLMQLAILKEDRNSEEKELEKQVEEQGLWRDSDWAKNKKAEREFHDTLRIEGGYYHPETGKFVQLLWKKQEDLDNDLRLGRMSGSDWIFRTNQNTAAIINARNALFGREEEDIEAIENPVDKLIAEYWSIKPIGSQTPGGDYDNEAFQAKREAKKAEITAMVGDPVAVEEYFKSFRRDTETQERWREAKEAREEFQETPIYMGDVTDTTINTLLDNTSAYLRQVGSRWGLARYIQWLYYQDPIYQTNEWAVAYWVAVGERDVVLNPDRDRLVMASPDMVLFYPGVFGEMSDNAKQLFVSENGTSLFSKDFLADLVEAGEISTQGSNELFQATPVLQ